MSEGHMLDRNELAAAARRLAGALANGPQDADQVLAFQQQVESHASDWADFAVTNYGYDPNVATRIVSYIADAYAIPPIGLEYRWFMATFDTLAELVARNTGISSGHILLLSELQRGVAVTLTELAAEM